MDLPRNGFKRALAQGKPQLGLWCSLASPLAAEVVAGAGFDWLLIDTEHSPSELPDVLAQLQAVAGYPTPVVVRPSWNEMVQVKRLLDIGAQSLLFPFVQDAEQARRAVAFTRYPPAGLRGTAGITRASGFGRVSGYAGRAQDELCVLVQVETRAALGQIEEMARVEGVDGIFVGPADLAADLGHVGNSGHPEVQAAIEDAIVRIGRAGKPAGILTPDEDKAQRYLALGATFVAIGIDIDLLVKGARGLLTRFRSAT